MGILAVGSYGSSAVESCRGSSAVGILPWGFFHGDYAMDCCHEGCGVRIVAWEGDIIGAMPREFGRGDYAVGILLWKLCRGNSAVRFPP